MTGSGEGSQVPSPGDPARRSGRRRLFKALLVLGATLALTPVVVLPLAERLVPRNGSWIANGRQKVIVDDASYQGAAAGKPVNVSDLQTFPPNSSWTVTYPSSGDAAADGKNPNTFVKFRLIRLPTELGGDSANASAFVAFSAVCTHLQCSLYYSPYQSDNPAENGYRPNSSPHQDLECPCHGNIYRLPDGVVTEGPSFLLKSPTPALPYLSLSADSQGFLWIEPPIWDYKHNGVVGYGRYVV